MAYSYTQLMQLWVQAGGSPAKAPLMAAIAMAESGGNPAAINRNTNGTTDRGLWQVNSIWGSRSTNDPLANARAAVYIEQKQGKTAWVTYNTGAYTKFYDPKERVSTTGPGIDWKSPASALGSLTGAPSNPLEAVSDTAHFIGALGKAETWLRVGEGILGAIAVIGGVMILVSVIADKSGAGRAVGQVVGIVGPGGKVAKVASVATSIKGKG